MVQRYVMGRGMEEGNARRRMGALSPDITQFGGTTNLVKVKDEVQFANVSKVAVQDFHQVVDHLQGLQLVVLLVHTKDKVQAGIPVHRRIAINKHIDGAGFLGTGSANYYFTCKHVSFQACDLEYTFTGPDTNSATHKAAYLHPSMHCVNMLSGVRTRASTKAHTHTFKQTSIHMHMSKYKCTYMHENTHTFSQSWVPIPK